MKSCQDLAKIFPRFECKILQRKKLGKILTGILPRSWQREFLPRILPRSWQECEPRILDNLCVVQLLFLAIKLMFRCTFQEFWSRSWQDFLPRFLARIIVAKIPAKNSCQYFWQESWHKLLSRFYHRFLPRFLSRMCQDSWLSFSFLCEGLYTDSGDEG